MRLLRPMRRATPGPLALAVLGLALWLAAPARAQEIALEPGRQVALVADSVTYDTNTGQVVAEGAVEVYYGNRTLTARRIVYDSRTEQITAEGDITLRDPDGDVTIYADIAELDAELRDGLVLGARSVMGENVRLSAVEARRIDDRYNALSKAVYSPCAVCADDPTPLWRIRARRVIHDQQERVIHYENAFFDVFGVPVLWVPYFRHADPTVERSSGFLVPEIVQSSTFGYGIRAPYYWVIDEFSDATIEPFVTSDEGLVMIGEYRRRFIAGDLFLRASGTLNDYQGNDELHGNLEAVGDFETKDGIDWGFDIDAVTDDSYLSRYEFSDADRLQSEVYVRDYTRRGYFDLSAIYFQSLREGEPAGQIPLVVPDFEARYEMADPFLAGEWGFFADTATLIRNDGDDTARISLGADWERETITAAGLVLKPFAEARIDFFASGQNATFADDTGVRIAPLAGIEARYPLINDRNPDAIHVIEPIAQAIVAPYGSNNELPNEDSLLTEFDETGLFERNHFPGIDGFEEGPRLNLGVRYERISTDGLDFDASLGRVLRPSEAEEFSDGSGLVSAQSDWVGAWSASYQPWFTIRQRVRVDDAFNLTRNEVYGGFEIDPVGLDIGYVFFEKDPRIEAPADREEVSAEARIRLTDAWSLGAYVQRDLGRDRFVETGGSVTYETECVAVELGLEQSYTDLNEDAPSSTSIGLQVRLKTLGSDPDDGDGVVGRCKRPG